MKTLNIPFPLPFYSHIIKVLVVFTLNIIPEMASAPCMLSYVADKRDVHSGSAFPLTARIAVDKNYFKRVVLCFETANQGIIISLASKI